MYLYRCVPASSSSGQGRSSRNQLSTQLYPKPASSSTRYILPSIIIVLKLYTKLPKMPSDKDHIVENICRLGLVTALPPRRTEQWEPLPAVNDFYIDRVDRIVRQYVDAANTDDIRYSEKLRQEAATLLNEYGPVIWPRRTSVRLWLFQANDNRARGLYKRDLYWDQLSDWELYAIKWRPRTVESTIQETYADELPAFTRCFMTWWSREPKIIPASIVNLRCSFRA